MALLFVDSFDHYATADIAKKWTIAGGGTITSGAGRNGGKGMRQPLGAYKGLLEASGATVIIGAALQYQSTFVSVAFGLEIMFGGSAADTSRHGWFGVTSGGVPFYHNNALGVDYASGVTLSLATFYFIEVKVVLSTIATGSVVVKIDGAPIINQTGIVTGNSVATWSGLRMSSAHDIDDLYICDGSGSLNNEFLGDCRVEALLPQTDAVSAGTNAGLTPSTGTDHGALVDEAAPNGDTDYNSGATAGLKDTYQFPSMTSSGAVKGVQVLLYARKSDQAVKTLCPVLRHGGTDYDGATVTAAASYEYKRQVYETNPGTGIAFTAADVNALQAGMKIVA